MYGIADNELHWFSSYLKNRQQMVFFQQECSEFKEIYSGVPQGSVLYHIFSPDWITDTPSGDALLKVISIVCRESKIFVLELYVITMIILTLEV